MSKSLESSNDFVDHTEIKNQNKLMVTFSSKEDLNRRKEQLRKNGHNPIKHEIENIKKSDLYYKIYYEPSEPREEQNKL